MTRSVNVGDYSLGRLLCSLFALTLLFSINGCARDTISYVTVED